MDLDVCLDECSDNILRFAVQVGNQGLGPLVSGTQLLAYTDYDTLVGVKALPANIPAMGVSDAIEFEIDADKIQNGVLRVHLDVDDCGDGNNWFQTTMPGVKTNSFQIARSMDNR